VLYSIPLIFGHHTCLVKSKFLGGVEPLVLLVVLRISSVILIGGQAGKAISLSYKIK
jgi:hypothetical protein